MQHPQKSVRADGYTSLARQTGTTFAAGLQGERRQQFSRPVRATGVACQSSVEPFSKDLSRATRRITEPAPTVHAHAHDLAAPGEVQWVPLVATMLPPT